MTTILIVDDSKLARIVIRRALAALESDWKIVEASSADTAMAALSAEPIHAALIDYNMPGKNGLEVLEDIRALYPSLPVALTTANVQDAILEGARALNAAYLRKPMSAEVLQPFISSI